MLKQSIWAGLLALLMVAPLSMDNDTKEAMQQDVKEYAITKGYCDMEDLGEMDYYLFCDSQLHLKGSGAGFTFRPVIIGSETKTIEEAKELYQEFAERLPLEPVKEGEENNVFYVSPDCKWVITIKWSEYKHTGTQTLFYEKEKVREKISGEMGSTVYPILIVKDRDCYKEMDKEHYEKLLEMDHIVFYDGGYDDLNKINAEGNLLAGIQDDYTLITIREIEDGTEQWSFSLRGIQEEMARIRDDIEEGDRVYVSIQQFEGNEKEGWLTVQAENSSFFRIAYPSGEVTYLGEYLYAVSFSPDGKYAAYSSEEDYDSGVVMTQEEYERVRRTCPPGICVREIATGKTAYIYWYPARNPEEDSMEYRRFLWIEKEGFEEFMGENDEK